MAKSLGMIHTVNHRLTLSNNPLPGLPANQDGTTVDLSGLLTRQLQRMCRQGNYYKLVGIDMTIDPGNLLTQGDPGGIISGQLNYFQPTAGRCAASIELFSTYSRPLRCL